MTTAAATDCPPLEDIAAFLDGALSGEVRDRVVAHLAECEACYEVFAGAARFQLDEAAAPAAEEQKPGAEVVPFRRRKIAPWIGSLAAVLVVGLAAVPLYRASTERPDLRAAELVGPEVLAGVPDEELWKRRWTERTMRGGEGEGTLTDIPAELLVGAHLVDLRLMLQQNDSDEADDSLIRISQHIGNVLFAQPQEEAFGELRDRLESQEPSALLPEVDRIEAGLEEISSFYLDFGKWLEAGRLAALAERPDFFEDRTNRRFLTWLLRHAEEEMIDEKVVAELEQIRTLLEKSEGGLPYAELAERFKAILLRYEDLAGDASASAF